MIRQRLSFGEIRFTEKQIMEHIQFRNHVQYSRVPFVNLHLPTHAITNWNMRVGPMANRVLLERLFRALSHQSHRIRLYGRMGYGLIDEDILFVQNKKSPKDWVIVTLYGRISLNPPIYSIPLMKVPKVNLKQSNGQLKSQVFPVVACSVLSLSDHGKHRYLEKYKIGREEYLYVLTTQCAEILSAGGMVDMPTYIRSLDDVQMLSNINSSSSNGQAL